MISDFFRHLISIRATVFRTAILHVADFAPELWPLVIATFNGVSRWILLTG